MPPTKRTVSTYEMGKLADEAAAAAAAAAGAIPKSLATAADQTLYSTGVGAWAATAFGAFGRSIAAAVDRAALMVTLALTKSDVGLGNVDNTSDATKNVLYAATAGSATPTAHAASHASGGSDAVTIAESQVTNLTTDLAARVLKAGDTMTGALAINSPWSSIAGMLSMSGADSLGYLPVLVRNTDAGVNAQAGMDFGFDNSHRVTFAVSRSGQAAPFTSAAYFYCIGQPNGLRFLTGDATDVGFYTNSGLRGLFKGAGPFEVGARTSSTSSNEAKQVIFGATVNSTTPEVLLRLVRNENPNQYYPSSVDFLCYSYGSGGAPNYYANSVLKIRMKNLGTFSETTATDVLELRADGKVIVNNGPLILPKTSGVGVQVDPASPTYAWKDLLGELTVKGSGSGNPDWAAFRGAIYAYSFGNSGTQPREIWQNFHIPHDYLPGSDMYIHVHWAQNVVDTGGTAGVPGKAKWNFDISYAKGYSTAGGAGNAFSAPVSTYVLQQGSTTQYAHMIAEVQFTNAGGDASHLDNGIIETDGLILVHMSRSAGTIPDTLNQNPFVFYVDLHYQTTGVMGTKQKNPPFWT